MKENENPSAFPHVVYNQNDGHWEGRYEIYKQDGGMALLDYFAAKAMQALIAKLPLLDREGEHGAAKTQTEINQTVTGICDSAYWYAEEMLKQRQVARKEAP